MALENIRDLLAKRVDQLDSGKHDVMTEAKLIIVEQIKVEVRIISYQNGTLRVATEDSSAASEIRLQAPVLLGLINEKTKPEVVKFLRVTVR
jgi:hypothetical protein